MICFTWNIPNINVVTWCTSNKTNGIHQFEFLLKFNKCIMFECSFFSQKNNKLLLNKREHSMWYWWKYTVDPFISIHSRYEMQFYIKSASFVFSNALFHFFLWWFHLAKWKNQQFIFVLYKRCFFWTWGSFF